MRTVGRRLGRAVTDCMLCLPGFTFPSIRTFAPFAGPFSESDPDLAQMLSVAFVVARVGTCLSENHNSSSVPRGVCVQEC